MKVGLSLSRCMRDIFNGTVDEEEEIIETDTAEDDLRTLMSNSTE